MNTTETQTQTRVRIYETQVNIYAKNYLFDYFLNLRELKRYILSCIENEDYNGQELKTTAEKLTFVKDCFLSEYCHANNLRRYKYDYKILFAEWLQGLPSSISTVFYYHDIKNLFKSIENETSCFEDQTEDDQHEILQSFFNVIAVVFFDMLEQNEIEL